MSVIYEKKCTIAPRDVDQLGFLKSSSLLSFMQETASEHAIGNEVLYDKYGAVWMIARTWFECAEPIDALNVVTIRTWQRYTKRAIVYRDYDIISNNKIVGQGVTNLIIVRQMDKKIVRPSTLPEFVASSKLKNSKPIIPSKFLMPVNMQKCGVHKVVYSDTDINGHMNNAKYADVACDYIDILRYGNVYISEMHIGYMAECFVGDDIIILKGEENGYIYILGTDNNGKDRFNIKVRLKNL